MPKSWCSDSAVTKPQSKAKTVSCAWYGDHGPLEPTIPLRAPICFNTLAARSQVPLSLKKTEVILASRSKDQMGEAIKAAFDRKELSTPETGAMCYMM